jgi:hypothetical protein
MRTTAAKKIGRTGYAVRMKRDDNIGTAETWMVSNPGGYPARVGADPLNTQECHGLVCAGALRRCEVIRLTGGIVYRLVQP